MIYYMTFKWVTGILTHARHPFGIVYEHGRQSEGMEGAAGCAKGLSVGLGANVLEVGSHALHRLARRGGAVRLCIKMRAKQMGAQLHRSILDMSICLHTDTHLHTHVCSSRTAGVG